MPQSSVDELSDEEMSDEEKTFPELLDEYKDQESMWHFEGTSGLDKLNKLTQAMGYQGHPFNYGSSLEEFLSDNPGACDALVEWISENGESAESSDGSWRENLISNLNESESDEDEG